MCVHPARHCSLFHQSVSSHCWIIAVAQREAAQVSGCCNAVIFDVDVNDSLTVGVDVNNTHWYAWEKTLEWSEWNFSYVSSSPLTLSVSSLLSAFSVSSPIHTSWWFITSHWVYHCVQHHNTTAIEILISAFKETFCYWGPTLGVEI